MSYSHIRSQAFNGSSIIEQVSFNDDEPLTSWELLDNDTNRILYKGSFTGGYSKAEIVKPFRVTHCFSDGLREYFKDQNGILFVLMADTHSKDQWCSVVLSSLEPSAPVRATFLDKNTGQEIISRSQIK